MAKEAQKRPRIKDFHTNKPKSFELWATLLAIRDKRPTHTGALTERARVILATSILEQQLQNALLSHFPIIDPENGKQMEELFEADRAPLGTFSSKIKIAYALGVFGPKTKKDLERLKSIRNACAHARIHVRFEDDAVRQECANLYALAHFKKALGPIPKTSQQQFFAAIAHYFMCFEVEENEGELPTPLRYRLSSLGHVFS